MSQTENDKSNIGDVLGSLGESANKVSNFLETLSGSLSPEQKAHLDKEMGGNNAFKEQMEKAQKNLTKALLDIQKFKTF